MDKDILIWPAEVYFLQIKSTKVELLSQYFHLPNLHCDEHFFSLNVCDLDETAELSRPEEDKGHRADSDGARSG